VFARFAGHAEERMMVGDELKKIYPKGAKVKPNVGGPIMVVKDYTTVGSSRVICQWFVGKKLEEGRFVPGTLEFVKEEQSRADAAST
jgi:uncharacterized protein YodC (DUF2158 family)